jgi:hypothetical protein
MELLYCGSPLCPEATFKRLLMVADGVSFMDRPSVTFGKWGTIGSDSPARQFIQVMASTPVPLSVYKPPSGPVSDLYRRYIEADLADGEFRRIFLAGLAGDPLFAEKFIQMDAQYGSPRGNYMLSGREVVRALLADEALLHAPISVEEIHENMYAVRDDLGRRATLALELTEASIQVTNAMLLSAQTGLLPVTDDPFLSELLALRTTQPYVKGVPARAPILGLAVAQAVITDEALQRLTIKDIVDYRTSAKDAYAAWSIELNRLAATIDDIPGGDVEKRIARLITTEVAPKLREYRNEMKSASDKLFGDLVKNAAKWGVPAVMPTLSLAYFLNMSLEAAAVAFATNAVLPAVPAVVDYLQATARVKRKNAMSYLIGLAQEAE